MIAQSTSSFLLAPQNRHLVSEYSRRPPCNSDLLPMGSISLSRLTEIVYRWPSILAVVVFASTLLVFSLSPNRQVGDSKFSFLVSHSLLEHGSFTLERYKIPNLLPPQDSQNLPLANLYQLEWQDEHLYYFMPVGSCVLSVPFVALGKVFGTSVVNVEQAYRARREIQLQSLLASLLMASLTVVILYTSQLILPLGWSLLVALGSAFGTQVWSTASRAVWAETWGMLLLGIVIFILLAHSVGKRKVNPVLLATLLAWMYFVRPTNSISIAAITIYLLIANTFKLRFWLLYTITGIVWLAGFFAYSYYHFSTLLPRYYLVSRLSYRTFWEAVLGNLVSPSRGLLIFVPVLLFVGFLLIRHWAQITFRPLALLSLVVMGGHMIVISAFWPWHGGGCFGPRYSAGLVPWFAVLSVLGIKGMLKDRAAPKEGSRLRYWDLSLWVGGALLAVSIFINGRGAISPATVWWNDVPINVEIQPSKVWDWTYPQFLAGLINPPQPYDYPLLEHDVDFLKPESQKYVWYGWSPIGGNFHWTEGEEAGLVFALDEVTDLRMEMTLEAFLVPGKVDRQRMNVFVNDQAVASFVLDKPKLNTYSFTVSQAVLDRKNRLVLDLPDAASPEYLGVAHDGRRLGITMRWLGVSRFNRQ